MLKASLDECCERRACAVSDRRRSVAMRKCGTEWDYRLRDAVNAGGRVARQAKYERNGAQQVQHQTEHELSHATATYFIGLRVSARTQAAVSPTSCERVLPISNVC